MPGEEHGAWVGSMPEVYDRCLGPAVFRPFALDMAARVAAAAPRTVLELAAGTGILTRELVALGPRVGAVTATDLNEAMVVHGAAAVPEARWAVADAQAPADVVGAVDAVVCQFGVMFLPDRPAAFAHARRLLAPGGTLLFSTWAALDAHGFERSVVAAVRAVLPDDPPTFLERVPHGYADAERVTADVRAGGFTDVVLETVTLTGHTRSVPELVAGYCTGTPMRAELVARGDLAELTDAVVRHVVADLGPGPADAAMSAHVVRARG